MNKENYRRRSIRLPTYDYSQGGWYFVTICTQNFRCDFGNIVNAEMELLPIGQMVDREWRVLKNRFSSIDLDEYIIMPNHLHGIVVVKDDSNFVGAGLVPAHGQGDHKGRPYNKCPVLLGDIIGAFKSIKDVVRERHPKQPTNIFMASKQKIGHALINDSGNAIIMNTLFAMKNR